MWSTGEFDTPPEPAHLWSLREDVTVEDSGTGKSLVLYSRWGETILEDPDPVLRRVLHRMVFGPVHLENAVGRDADAPARLAALVRSLGTLAPFVVRSLGLDGGQPLLSVVPLSPQAGFGPVPVAADRFLKLSRFTVLRSDGREFVLESPLSLHRIVLHRSEALQLIAALAHPVTPKDAARASGHHPEVAAQALSFLVAAGMVVWSDGGADGRPPEFGEDQDPALAGWTAYGLMFHTRSRLGRHDDPVGAVGGPVGEPPWEPAVKAVEHPATLALYRPDWNELVAADPPLTVVLEARHSARSFRPEPLTAREIGELLYRCLRVRSRTAPRTDEHGDEEWARTDRPWPSAGSAHELEFYLTLFGCSGIPDGGYRYDPLGHRLERVSEEPASELLLCGRVAVDPATATPPLLITMTARFGRVLADSSSVGYALALKHVGVVMQTLYLVSEAMGLDACAIAAGDIDVAARAFGLDWRAESSVGEMAIGRRTTAHDGGRPGTWISVNDANWPARASCYNN